MGAIMNKLLQNAIVSIRLGVKDYFSSDPERVFSAMRNIYAGILLMFKSKLLDLCPNNSDEVLVKSKMIPVILNGTVIFKGEGKNTVDVSEIEKRFSSLGISVDWKLFKNIQKERNNIEHYYTTVDNNSISLLIVDSIVLMSDFIKNELEEIPIDLMGDTWTKLLSIQEIYLKEKKECDEKIDTLINIDDEQLFVVKNITCTKCGSDLLFPVEEYSNISDIELVCSKCSETINVDNVFEETYNEQYNGIDYGRALDGYEPIIKDCPECGKKTFNEQENICSYCLYTKEDLNCKRCGCSLSVEEQDSGGLCSYCEYVYNKTMEED